MWGKELRSVRGEAGKSAGYVTRGERGGGHFLRGHKNVPARKLTRWAGGWVCIIVIEGRPPKSPGMQARMESKTAVLAMPLFSILRA